jgi:hypothetical protein
MYITSNKTVIFLLHLSPETEDQVMKVRAGHEIRYGL